MCPLALSPKFCHPTNLTHDRASVPPFCSLGAPYFAVSIDTTSPKVSRLPSLFVLPVIQARRYFVRRKTSPSIRRVSSPGFCLMMFRPRDYLRYIPACETARRTSSLVNSPPASFQLLSLLHLVGCTSTGLSPSSVCRGPHQP